MPNCDDVNAVVGMQMGFLFWRLFDDFIESSKALRHVSLHTMISDNEISSFYSRLFKQNERVIKLGLDAIRRAFQREKTLESLSHSNGCVQFPHIIVAGTNGKGQVSALLSNAFTLSGLKTALYTSPHLVDFRERMRIDGEMISKDEVADIGNAILAQYGGDETPEFSGITLTYFECCLLMACRYFNAHHAQMGVFEVGLGGRLDATNALAPALSIITSIGRDHEQYLGHTLEQIAHEKAGIMRPNAPCIVGRTAVDALRDEARAHRTSAFYALGSDFDWCIKNDQCVLETKNARYFMHGAESYPEYQRDNAAVACFSLICAQRMGLLPGAVDLQKLFAQILSRTQWVGRMWTASDEAAKRFGVKRIVLDGAHNPDGVRAFCRAIASCDKNTSKALVVNSCGDKNIENMFPQYLEIFDASCIFVAPIAATSRAMSPIDYCRRVGLSSENALNSVIKALQCAAHKVGGDGTIYVSGSLYLIGEVLQTLGEADVMQSILKPNA